jgi:diadenosine tetraphosphate (Ap4A) HIT family hydrolase
VRRWAGAVVQRHGRVLTRGEHTQVVPHVHVHVIPKTTDEDGLGVGWPAQPTDHAKFAQLAEQLRGRM